MSVYEDRSLDESGYTPEVLSRIDEMGKRLPYREASKILKKWGIEIGKSSIGRKEKRLNGSREELIGKRMKARGKEGLGKGVRKRRWVLEIDGKYVPTQGEGGVEWREVKTAVLYRMLAPSERYYVSYLGGHETFGERVEGLLRHAGVQQQDELIGISDGASWIAELMKTLAVSHHILDVYHASSYFESLMVALKHTDNEGFWYISSQSTPNQL